MHLNFSPRATGLGHLSALADETLFAIFWFLSDVDLLSASEVSVIFHIFATDEALWRHLCLKQQTNKILGDFEFFGNWKWTHFKCKQMEGGRWRPASAISPPKKSLQPIPLDSKFLFQKWYRAHVRLDAFVERGDIERRSCKQLGSEEFKLCCEQPLVLTDISHSWHTGMSIQLFKII